MTGTISEPWLRALDPGPEGLLLLREAHDRERQQHETLRGTITGSRPEWRELIRLRYVEGLRINDVAAAVDRSGGYTGRTLVSLRVKLAEALCQPISGPVPKDMAYRSARELGRATNRRNANRKRRRERRREAA